MRVHPFQNASALVMLCADWVVYAITMLSHMDSWAVTTLVVSIATLVLVSAFESHAADARHSLIRAILAALLVASPLPVLGTFVALVSLTWNAARRHPLHE